MRKSHLSPVPRAMVPVDFNGSRLSWLLAVNEIEAQRMRTFRNSLEQEQLLLMNHPVAPDKAYAFLGFLLGLLPPAAIFARLFGYGLTVGSLGMKASDGALFFLCLVMNVVCGLGGYAMGSVLGRQAFMMERSSWSRMVTIVPLLGASWGAATGVAGGFFFFGIGAFFGCAIGVPVGFFGFLMFAIIHRLVERGGMIDARHVVPLSLGIAAIISSLIAGL